MVPMSISTDVIGLAHRLLQALRDVVEVVGDAAEQVAPRRAVEVAAAELR